MEGFSAALIISGAALVTARGPSRHLRQLHTVIRALTLATALLSLAALVVGFALCEWLTVSWALGLTSCSLALCAPTGMASWWQKLATVVILTLPTIGVVMCIGALTPNAPWLISQAVAHASYRTSTQLVAVGNGLLNLTALLLAANRIR